MLLSVLSALARLDVDPWQEADELAQLPGETATRRLASMIAALPDGQSGHLDPGTAATRLIALLPRRASSDIVSSETLFGVSAVGDLRGFLYAVVIFIALVQGAQWIIASHQPPAQVDNAAMPVTGTFVPKCRTQASDFQVHLDNKRSFDRREIQPKSRERPEQLAFADANCLLGPK
jgi:hypothetical protein